MSLLRSAQSVLIVPLAVLVGVAVAFVGLQGWQRLQPPPSEVTEAEATPEPGSTPAAEGTPTGEPPAGPFGLRVSLPFTLPVLSPSLPFTLPVSAPRLPFISGPEPTATPTLTPTVQAGPVVPPRRGTPTPRPTTTPRAGRAMPSPTVLLAPSRAGRQYAESVGRSLEQFAASNQRYATVRYTWRPAGDTAAAGRTALDLHDMARAAQAQALALERPAPPPGLEGLGQTAASAWTALGESAVQYACVVLSEGRDRACLQRASEAQVRAREAEQQATLVLARVAEPLRMPTPTPTPRLGDYWTAVAPRLEAMRDAADVVGTIVSAHARGEVENAALCRLTAYAATFAAAQVLAPLAPPPGWTEFHQAFVGWSNHYSEGLASLARFCAAVPVAAAGATPTPQVRQTPTPVESPDLDRARTSFIAGDAERDRFEAILARPPSGALR